MKKSSLMPWVSVLAVLVVIVSINLLAGVIKARVDLTEDRAYTLSAGTKAILQEIASPIQLRLYVASSEGSLPPVVKNYVKRVEDLLVEMVQASNGKLQLEKLEPLPDSDAEDSARLDGIEPQPVTANEMLYLGLSATMVDKKVALPFLAPDRERLLEYDIARAITRVTDQERPLVGVMTSLPAFGQPTSMMMGGGRGSEPWALIEELRRDFDVREVSLTAAEIPPEISVLVVIHPKGITPATEYAIDQFILRGGRLIAFLDPYCLFDSGGPMPEPSTSSLPTLLAAWGLTFDTSRIVADLDFIGVTREGRAPGVLALTTDAMNPDDVLTSGLDNALMAYAGSYGGTPAAGLTVTDLFRTSTNSELIDPTEARMAPERLIRDFAASGTEMPLALRVTGKFKTAFPNGLSGSPDAPQPDTSGPQEMDNTVLLIGDADMIQDPISVTEVRGLFPGGRMFVPTNGNLAFAQSAVEQLAGDENLIAVRSRAALNRPFTVVRAMQAEAEKKFQETIRNLETSLEETQKRLDELQAGKQEGQKFLLSPEQQKEIEGFRAKETEVRKNLKETRRELRSEIDALENRLKWLNIAALPTVVILVGVTLALWRRQKANPR